MHPGLTSCQRAFYILSATYEVFPSDQPVDGLKRGANRLIRLKGFGQTLKADPLKIAPHYFPRQEVYDGQLK